MSSFAAIKEENAKWEKTKITESSLANLDSSLKKNTAFVKKLKAITADQTASLESEFRGLKLGKYVSEAVTNIIENKFKKSADISACVAVCSLFYQRYAEFVPSLLPKVVAIITDKDKDGDLHRQKMFLRLLLELFIVGTFADDSIVHSAVQSLLNDDGKIQVSTLSIPILLLRSYKAYPVLCPGSALWNMLVMYYNKCESFFLEYHRRLKSMEARHREVFNAKGDISEKQKAVYETAIATFDKLKTAIASYAELLDRKAAELKEEVSIVRVDGLITFADPKKKDSLEDISNSLFENEDERLFYEELVDLKVMVPGIVFKEENTEDNNANGPVNEEIEFTDDMLEKEKENSSLTVESDKNTSAEDWFSKIATLQSKELCDAAAVNFCYISTAKRRKRLAKMLLTTDLYRVDLLPYCCRLVATLNPFYPDIAEQILSYLAAEFRAYSRKKLIGTPLRRARLARYLAELTKFKVMPVGQLLVLLHNAVDDFTHLNVDLVCSVLEACGRFLYKNPATVQRMVILLEIITRKRQHQIRDNRQITLIDNALYMCNPPELQTVEQKEIPTELQYIQFVLLCVVHKTNLPQVLNKVRKVDWNNVEYVAFLRKIFLKVWKMRYSNIHLIASLLYGLSRYHPEFSTMIVDEVLEEIRLCLERNAFGDNQKRLALMKYVGEMYIYKLIEHDTIFDVLYTVIAFGYENGFPVKGGRINMFDMPDDLFRIRLICTLLFTCGAYFSEGLLKDLLDTFLIFFQYYILTKNQISMDVEFMISDVFQELRPDIPRFQNIEDALMALEKVKSLETPAQHLVDQRETLESESDESIDDLSSVTESEGSKNISEDDDGSEDGQMKVIQNYAEVDLDFERELQKMVNSSLESRRSDKKDLDVALPLGFKSIGDPKEGSDVSFTVLLKRKNKNLLKELVMPSDSAFVQSSMKKYDILKEETKEIQQLTLKSQDAEEKQSQVKFKFYR